MRNVYIKLKKIKIRFNSFSFAFIFVKNKKGAHRRPFLFINLYVRKKILPDLGYNKLF